MKPSMIMVVVMVSIANAVAMPARAADPSGTDRMWHQWRGPLGNGVAPHGDPPVEWSESKNVRWKVALPGSGHATPIVFGERIYILTAIKTGEPGAGAPQATQEPQEGRRRRRSQPTHKHQFVVMALERGSGKVVWQHTARTALPHEGHHGDATFASASPITDGAHLIAHFGSNGVYGYDLTGKQLWHQDLGKMRVRRGFGEGSSPALHGNVVVINWDHEDDSFIVALDKRSGQQLWKVPRDEVTSWSTPLIVEIAGRPQVIVNATSRVRGYDLATGEVIWECGGQTVNTVPSPVYGHGLVFAMSGFRGNALKAIRVAEARGDVSGSPAVAWEYGEDTPYAPSPLLYDDALYFLKHNRGILSCFDARTGKPHYARQRLEGIDNVYASPVGAAGRIYIAGRDGTTVVLERGPQLKILATNKLDEGHDASPAIVGRALYLRGDKSLYCIASQ